MSLKVWSRFVDFCIYIIETRSLYDALVISTLINRLDTRDKDWVIDDIGMRLAIENPEAYRWFFLEVVALSSSPEERAAIAEKLNLDLADIQKTFGYHEAQS